ncbi:unnamed protein product [Cochlearia groenlandica]
MQDIHDYSMNGSGGEGGSTGRFFVRGIVGGGGGGGGGDRRMRAHQNNILNHHQSLKCPRCNSLNTKFCYYNNYNLSQPRHFCKNCRRYWTKGGVLRNVPVGGGCRKAKRSKSKQPPSSPSRSSADKPIAEEEVDEKSSSSSESSSLTASNSNVAAVTTTVAAVTVTDMPNMKIYENGIEWSTLLGQGSSNGGIFSIDTAAFEIGGNSVNQQSIADDDMKLEGGNNNNTVQQQFGDPTAQIDPLDWGSGVGGGDDQTLLFDLTSNVDHTYWSQSQWTTSVDQDHNGLYLP